MGKDCHGFCLAVFFGQLLPVLYGIGVSPEKKYGSLREGPFQMDVADLPAGASEAFTSGLSGWFNQPAVGDEILHSFKTGDIMYLIENDQTEYPAIPGTDLRRK